jgi:serine phosphatase RsbU (regulator of sigma subunit)
MIRAAVDLDDSVQIEMRRIVEALYGPPVRRLPGLDVGRAYRGAEGEFKYGGDVVDVFAYGGGFTALAVVDITGHGMRAATNAGLTKHALRAFASQGLDARDCVRSLNRLCIENSRFEGDEEFFATLFFGIIQPDRRRMQYVAAGHEAAFFVEAGDSSILPANGPIIGLLDDPSVFDQRILELHTGSTIVAVTDGFSEARDSAGTFLGSGRLVDVVRRNRGTQAEVQAEAIVQFAYEFSDEHLRDDVAALVVNITA